MRDRSENSSSSSISSERGLPTPFLELQLVLAHRQVPSLGTSVLQGWICWAVAIKDTGSSCSLYSTL